MNDSGLVQVFFASRSQLVRFLKARGAAEDAEDLIQELYLKLDGVVTGPLADPRSYLFRMASNLMLDRRRTHISRLRREEEWGLGGNGSSEADDRPSAEERLIAREQLQSITDALGALPDRTLAIFQRFRLDGESQRAIADEMKISLSAVEKHLQRAYHSVVDAKLRFDAGSDGQLRHPPEGKIQRD